MENEQKPDGEMLTEDSAVNAPEQAKVQPEVGMEIERLLDTRGWTLLRF